MGFDEKNLINVVQLSLNGASRWTLGDILVTNSSIENTGTFTILGGNSMRKLGGVGGFTNKAGGTVTKTGGGTTTFNIPASNSGTLLLNSNTIAFEQGLSQVGNGVTDLGTNGRLEVSGQQSLFHHSSGILRGGGTIAGTLANGGEVRIENNLTISVTGDYTQHAGGKLSFKRNAAGWGSFVVGLTATLDGTLLIDNAGFPALPGQSVMTAGTLVGTFSAVPGYIADYDRTGAPNVVRVTPLA